MADTSVRNWSSLPKNPLTRILSFLNAHFYHHLLRAVCPAWRTALPLSGDGCPLLHHQLRSQSTLLGEIQEDIFFLVSSTETHQPQKWAIQVTETGPNTWFLFNPLTGQKYSFPLGARTKQVNLLKHRVTELGRSLSLRRGNDSVVSLVCLPLASNNSFVFMGLSHHGNLCFCASGFENWVEFCPKDAFGEELEVGDHINGPMNLSTNAFEDIISFKGRFYAVDGKGRLVMFYSVSWQEPVHVVTCPVDIHRRWCTAINLYLVESEGSLYLVVMKRMYRSSFLRHYLEVYEGLENDARAATKIQVFILTEEKEWKEVRSIGDRVFFIGRNATFSVSSSTFVMNEKNCIYLSGVAKRCNSPNPDVELGFLSEAIHDLSAGEFVLFDGRGRRGDNGAYTQLFWPPPSWICGYDRPIPLTGGVVTGI